MYGNKRNRKLDNGKQTHTKVSIVGELIRREKIIHTVQSLYHSIPFNLPLISIANMRNEIVSVMYLIKTIQVLTGRNAHIQGKSYKPDYTVLLYFINMFS